MIISIHFPEISPGDPLVNLSEDRQKKITHPQQTSPQKMGEDFGEDFLVAPCFLGFFEVFREEAIAYTAWW
jgi:hypothetical protein